MKHNYEQVFQLYAEKMAGMLSPGELHDLDQKLSADASFRQTWQLIEKEAEDIKAGEFAKKIDAATELELLKKKLSPRSPVVSLKKILSAAAVLVLMLAGGYFIFNNKKKITGKEEIAAAVQKNRQSVSLLLGDGKAIEFSKDSNAQTVSVVGGIINANNGTLRYTSQDTAQNTLWIPAGENYQLVLSDGTEVWLNAATRLRFPFRFGSLKREVYVEGEAYFKVAKDAAHPFLVHTPLTEVEVLGTSFNINTYHEGTVKTALVEGRVLTKSSDGKKIELKPGYEAGFKTTDGFATEAFDAEEVLSWRNGFYYFHNMPVTELAVIASRYYGVNIILDKDKFSGKSLTGLLDKHKLTDFLNDLETVAHIKYTLSGNDLYLK